MRMLTLLLVALLLSHATFAFQLEDAQALLNDKKQLWKERAMHHRQKLEAKRQLSHQGMEARHEHLQELRQLRREQG